MRAAAERDHARQHEHEREHSAHRENECADRERAPPRDLNSEQDALARVAVDERRRQRDRRDGGTHPDHAENAPDVVSVDRDPRH